MGMKGYLKCSDLICNPVVSSNLRPRNRQKAQRRKAVVDIDNYYILSTREIPTITKRICARTAREASTVDPEQYRFEIRFRFRAGFGNVWGLDIQEEAVLGS